MLQNLTPEESIKLFKKILKEEGVSSTWRWDDSLRVARSHQDFQFVRLQMHQKKQAYHEFLKEIKEEEREVEKLKKRRQRAIFLSLVRDCQESGIINLSSRTKFYAVQKKIANFDRQRYMAVDELDREKIFQDCIDDIALDEQNELQKRQKDNIRALKQLFTGHLKQSAKEEGEEPEGAEEPEQPRDQLAVETTWEDVQKGFAEHLLWR